MWWNDDERSENEYDIDTEGEDEDSQMKWEENNWMLLQEPSW